MYTFEENLEKIEYEKFTKFFETPSFMQQYNWSNIKTNWKNFHCGLYKNQKLVGVCLILVKNICKFFTIFYIPRGYLIDFTNYDDLKAMTDNIRILAKKNNATFVKIDPNFCIEQNSYKEKEIKKYYSENYDIKNKNLIKLGYINTGIKKGIGENFQPQFNMLAPLCDFDYTILNVQNLLSTYKSKFRYYLGDFHEKGGIRFEITNDISKINNLVLLLKQTEKKKHINLRNQEYFEKIMKNYKGQAYLVFGILELDKYLEFLKSNNTSNKEISTVETTIKEKGTSIILSGSLILLPKNVKGIRTSEYLYAGNSIDFDNLNISAGVVFEILKFSIKNNCHYCNLGGINGNLNDNLTIFKSKFNGQVLTFVGEYDLPINKFKYLIYKLVFNIYVYIKHLKRTS